jgi:PKD domain
LLEAFLYRAPASFAYQWKRNGSDIATGAAFTPTSTRAGDYTCIVTATNQAGSTSQTSSVKKVKDT